MMNKLFLFASVFAVLLSIVSSECPNGCSGAGSCTSRDMCSCYKNYQGNDCSLRTCPFSYAYVDTPKGDLDMNGAVDNTETLVGSQVYPVGTREQGFGTNQANEAHFYMECANRGVCDRAAGTCMCFDGYEGSSCQRTSCPNDCSGRGTCESISELATNAGGTLFHTSTYGGDTTYGLWDKKMSYGCKCDPWYYGSDCSLRRCKVGVDPMYEAVGTPSYESMEFRFAYSAAVISPSWFQIRFFDYWGEAYLTTRISADSTASATVATNTAAALTALPNGVISSVVCEDAEAETTLTYLNTFVDATYTTGNFIGCKFASNPGKLRLAEIHDSYMTSTGPVVVQKGSYLADVITTHVQGEDVDYCGLAGTALSAVTKDATAVTVATTAPTITVAKLIKHLGRYYLATASTATTLTLAFGYNAPTVAGGTTPFYYSSDEPAVSANDLTDWVVGSPSATFDTAAPSVSIGDLAFFQNQFFRVKAITSATVITFDRPFYGVAGDAGGTVATGTDKLYYWTTDPTTDQFTYVSECSGRGLCNTQSGVCDCFKGYTNDNCDTQNILAF